MASNNSVNSQTQLNQCVSTSPYATIPEHIRKILNACNIPQQQARSTLPLVIPLPPNTTQTNCKPTQTQPAVPLTLMVPRHPWQVGAPIGTNNMPRPSSTQLSVPSTTPLSRSPVTPISPLPSAAANASPNPAVGATHPSKDDLAQKLDIRTKQLNYVQKAYWTLKADFDRVCGVINNGKGIKSMKSGKRNKSETLNASKLRCISEDQPIDYAINDLQTKLKLKNAELIAMRQSVDRFKREKEEMAEQNSKIREEMRGMQAKMAKLSKDNQRLSKITVSATQKRRIRKKTLSELYLNSNRIKEFMTAIGKYGKLYQGLKTRQKNLIECVGNEDTEILKIRMKDLYDDIVGAEGGYQEVYESLDRMKIESQGKEFELMTKDKEYILSLEKAKALQNSHLEDYVKRNQSLQTDLVDREMKLRQAMNELNYLRQRVGCNNTATGIGVQ